MGASVFPLDDAWGLNETVYSEALAQRMVWLSGLLPYGQCEQVFARIGERMIPASSIWRQTQRHGQRLTGLVEHQRQQVSIELVKLPEARYDHDQRKGVTMDGGMVNIRGEGWRELKVGAVFDIEQRLERDVHTRQLEPHAHAAQVRYAAVLGSKDQFAPALWALAVQHQVPTAHESCVCADGAAWIWNIADEYFPASRQIVDWFHATQHLSQAAQSRYPDDDSNRQGWLKTLRDDLYLGQLATVIVHLEQVGLDAEAHYFREHQRRMQYLEFREEGYPIGSGTVESGVKQFKQRLTGAGMRWKVTAAQQMILLRAAVLGDEFDTLWAAA